MKNAFLYAFKASIPILVSFFPVGIAYGILMAANGYGWLWCGGTSLLVFARYATRSEISAGEN